MLETKADVGPAYDGDGDRIMMVDHLGNKADGDQILSLLLVKLYVQVTWKGGSRHINE